MRHAAPRIVPVLDVKNRVAVHAIGGVRSHYRPIHSRLHDSADPLALAGTLVEQFGLRELYLADLDAISGSRPDCELYSRLTSLGISLWIDAGLRDENDASALISLPEASLVAALESLQGPDALSRVLARGGSERVVFSLDLFQGQPRTAAGAAWPEDEPLELARLALGLGVKRLLLLELSRVGTGTGTGTEPLLERLVEIDSSVEIATGGGVSTARDVARLTAQGARAVLVGSALHDGRIARADLDWLRGQESGKQTDAAEATRLHGSDRHSTSAD